MLRPRPTYPCRCIASYRAAERAWAPENISSVSGWAFDPRFAEAPGQFTGCPDGQRNAEESECLAAVQQAAQGLRVRGIRVVDEGAEGVVPGGCSYSRVSQRAMFNRNAAGRSSSLYELVCIEDGPRPFGATDDARQSALDIRQQPPEVDGKRVQSVAQRINDAFLSAAPPFADGIAGSGVCVHMLDPDDMHSPDAPWLGCDETDQFSECPAWASLHSRSCSAVNAKWPYLWPGGDVVGWTFAPDLQVACAYYVDGGTGQKAGVCEKPRHRLDSVGAALSVDIARGVPTHNEIVVAGDTWMARLPSAIESFVIVDCSLYNQSWPMFGCSGKSVQDAVDSARHLRSFYRQKYPFSPVPPLIRFTGASFELVADDQYQPGPPHEARARQRNSWTRAVKQMRKRSEMAERALEHREREQRAQRHVAKEEPESKSFLQPA